MTRGTTPTVTFTLKDETIDLEEAASVYVTFRQGRRTLRKTGEELTLSGNVAEVRLSQSESLTFDACLEPVFAQLNWLYGNGARACSEIVQLQMKENLEPEVLT